MSREIEITIGAIAIKICERCGDVGFKALDLIAALRTRRK